MHKIIKGLVIKMELNPATEEIIYQKLGHFGCIHTYKTKLSDLEYVDKSSLNDNVFIRSSRSIVDQKLIFRIKSTGELMMFDIDGVWHEDGLKHELMI